MSEILFQAHSGVRYLVLLAAVVALVFITGHRTSGGMERPRRISLAAFAGVLDLQVLLGIILLFVRPFYGALMGHITMMLLAVAAAHILAKRARTTPQPHRVFTYSLLGVVLPLVLIIGGIMAIGRSVI